MKNLINQSLVLSLCLLLIPAAGFAADQAEAVPSEPGVYTGPLPEGGVGTVITTIPIAFSTAIIGAENDGSGNLLYTDNGLDEIGTMDTSAAQIGGLFTAAQGTGTNPLAATTDGTNFYVTDTTDDEIEIFDAAGMPIGTFSVAAQSTFPEGLTFNPLTGNLVMVDGDINAPDQLVEYTTAGALVGATAIASTSTDGIAYDPLTCTYWAYASGQDAVTQYNPADLSVITTFPGTAAAGTGTGEGVGIVGTTLYIVSATADTLTSFDVTGATSFCVDPDPIVTIPTLDWVGLLALFAVLTVAAFWTMSRRRRHA